MEPHKPRPVNAEQLFSASTVLGDAAEAVHGPRLHDYGTPTDNHTRTARFWSAYLGVEISPRQVCFLNILQKVARDMNAETHDNLVDIAGYAENCGLLVRAATPPKTAEVRDIFRRRVDD